MDRSQPILSALDELRQIRNDIRLDSSLDMVRRSFERLQEIRRQHLDDFDLQLIIADAQQEIIERARVLRGASEAGLARTPVSVPSSTKPESRVGSEPEEAQIPPEVPKLDQKSWKLAVGLALLFTAGICGAFFYLIQTARRLNFSSDQPATTQSSAAAKLGAPKAVPAANVTPPAVSMTPTLRLYTDLTGGTATIDNQPPKDLGDGELDLDSLTPGQHTVRVQSPSGGAAFTFALDDDKDVPRVTGILNSNNAMVVLVSVKNGAGRLNTDAAGAEVLLDDKLAGTAEPDGLLLSDLGSKDHNLEISQPHESQRFVLTYTSAPTLTVFVKSDPSTGVLTVSTGQDGVAVFINDLLYKRVTDHGALRIPLKVGSYHIRIHKEGFQDPVAAVVEIKRSAEASVQFHLQPVSLFGTLQIKGALPSTAVYVDHQLVATVGVDGTAKVLSVQPGDRLIELHHDQSIPKQISRTFETGQTITLTGEDVTLDRLAADNKSVIPANPGPPIIPPPEVPQIQPATAPLGLAEQVHRGGGFVAYHTPKTSGKYYFEAHAKLGGVLKHNKLQWYAGYQDEYNYVLFSIDGKHADVKEVRDGKPTDLGRIPFSVVSDEWVQIEVLVDADKLQTRAKAGNGGWTDLSPVTNSGHDFTKDGVGLYIPSNEEVAVANFRFSGR